MDYKLIHRREHPGERRRLPRRAAPRVHRARLPTSDVFAIVMEESSRARGVFQAIAYVDVNAGGDMMKFAENIALGRGIPVRLFASVVDARKWLEDQSAKERA